MVKIALILIICNTADCFFTQAATRIIVLRDEGTFFACKTTMPFKYFTTCVYVHFLQQQL